MFLTGERGGVVLHYTSTNHVRRVGAEGNKTTRVLQGWYQIEELEIREAVDVNLVEEHYHHAVATQLHSFHLRWYRW